MVVQSGAMRFGVLHPSIRALKIFPQARCNFAGAGWLARDRSSLSGLKTDSWGLLDGVVGA
jgi:hypothetical protein